jgi:hypothetical protein
LYVLELRRRLLLLRYIWLARSQSFMAPACRKSMGKSLSLIMTEVALQPSRDSAYNGQQRELSNLKTESDKAPGYVIFAS